MLSVKKPPLIKVHYKGSLMHLGKDVNFSLHFTDVLDQRWKDEDIQSKFQFHLNSHL